MTKLASAILTARSTVHAVVSPAMKSTIMEKDTRAIVASILDKIGMFIEEPSSAESSIHQETKQWTKTNYASPHELAENSLKFDSCADDVCVCVI